MTLTRFVTKSAFRNKRRSILTMGSIALSLLLLTLMMTVWRSFYIDQGSAQSAQRLITRHKVSLIFFLPAAYRAKIRSIPGVTHVVNETWFGGFYKENKPENFFAQFGTDPQEVMDLYPEAKIDHDQLEAWKKDRAGTIVDSELAKKYGWKVGDKIVIIGTIFPLNLELTVRGIFTADAPTQTIYFNNTYLDEGYSNIKGAVGFYTIMADSAASVPRVAKAVDDMFRNNDRPTKTESERAFQLDWIASLGNVKAFILSICLAVVFATLLVAGNTMAMSIRERTREVAVMKALGFTRGKVLGLFVSEGVSLALVGGVVGALGAYGLVFLLAHAPGLGLFFGGLKLTVPTLAVALMVAASVGFVSTFIPSYGASRTNIVDGLRHIG
jgi:putative ABC transport system permease protein